MPHGGEGELDDYVTSIDDRDIERARDYSRRYPTNFATRIERLPGLSQEPPDRRPVHQRGDRSEDADAPRVGHLRLPPGLRSLASRIPTTWPRSPVGSATTSTTIPTAISPPTPGPISTGGTRFRCRRVPRDAPPGRGRAYDRQVPRRRRPRTWAWWSRSPAWSTVPRR